MVGDDKKEKKDVEKRAAGKDDLKGVRKTKIQRGSSQSKTGLIGPYTKQSFSGESKSCDEMTKFRRGLEDKEPGHSEVGGGREGTDFGVSEKLGEKDKSQ